MLDILERQLTPVAAQPGFYLCSTGAASDGDGDVQLLEYRAEDRRRRRLLLDFCHLPHQQTITSELWSPDDLTARQEEATDGTVAMHRGVWQYDRSDDPNLLARTILSEVTTWLHQDEPSLRGQRDD